MTLLLKEKKCCSKYTQVNHTEVHSLSGNTTLYHYKWQNGHSYVQMAGQCINV